MYVMVHRAILCATCMVTRENETKSLYIRYLPFQLIHMCKKKGIHTYINRSESTKNCLLDSYV